MPLFLTPSHSPSLSSSLFIPKGSQDFLPCGKFKFLPPSLQVQEGEYPNRLDPKNPVYAEETSPSVIVNGFSERLQASHIQRIRPHSENLVGSRARPVAVIFWLSKFPLRNWV